MTRVLSRLAIRVHGIHNREDSLFIISKGYVVEGKVERKNKAVLTLLFLSLGSLVEIRGKAIIVGKEKVELEETDILPVSNYYIPSFQMAEWFAKSEGQITPVLPYFDVIYNKPAAAVPLWFKELFEERCKLCRPL